PCSSTSQEARHIEFLRLAGPISQQSSETRRTPLCTANFFQPGAHSSPDRSPERLTPKRTEGIVWLLTRGASEKLFEIPMTQARSSTSSCQQQFLHNKTSSQSLGDCPSLLSSIPDQPFVQYGMGTRPRWESVVGSQRVLLVQTELEINAEKVTLPECKTHPLWLANGPFKNSDLGTEDVDPWRGSAKPASAEWDGKSCARQTPTN
ncbi:hypothetical protein KUCAC02_020932, partial [Chaenocephalus aceratus]